MTRSGPGSDDPERRILDDFGSDSGFLAFADVSNADLLFLVPALLVAMVALEITVIATGQFFAGVALALVVLGIAGAYVYICPDHRTPLGLLRSFIAHHRRETTMTLTTDTDDGTDTPPDVRELTRVRAVEPEADAIRRRDETLVGALRIEPANLALADPDQWDRAARGLGSVLNSLDYPVQIHSSARRVDPERMTAAYDDRRTDPDVKSTPALQEIVEKCRTAHEFAFQKPRPSWEEIVDVYRRRRPQEFHERGTSIRRYHATIPVDIQAVSLQENAWVGRLESVPLVGTLLASVLADALMQDERRGAIEERQRSILEERRTHLADQLTSVEGVDVHPVTAADLTTLVEEYWCGQRTEYTDAGPHLRTAPVVTSETDGTEHRPQSNPPTSTPTEADHQ